MALDSFRRPYWLVYVPIIMVVAAAAGCTSMLAGNTGGTYSLLRLAILLVVAGAVLFWRRWRLHAVIGLALWAFVASPMVTNRQFLGFQDTPPPGLQPLSQAPALLRGDAWDSGVYMATMAEKNYLNGEGSYAHADLVAWTVTWLPWPHLSRAQIIGIGGNFDEFWIFEEEIRAGTATGRTVFMGKRDDPSGAVSQMPGTWHDGRPDDRRYELVGLESRLRIGFLEGMGWIVMLGAIGVRRIASRQPPST